MDPPHAAGLRSRPASATQLIPVAVSRCGGPRALRTKAHPRPRSRDRAAACRGITMPISSVSKMAQNNLLNSKTPASEIMVRAPPVFASPLAKTPKTGSPPAPTPGCAVVLSSPASHRPASATQWVQGQLDGQTSIPKAEVARTQKWKRNATKQAELSRTAADILDVSDLKAPTSYTLKTLGNGQEMWVPLGRGECILGVEMERRAALSPVGLVLSATLSCCALPRSGGVRRRGGRQDGHLHHTAADCAWRWRRWRRWRRGR